MLLAASNTYDAMYLGRSLGVAPVPWPGTSPQLASIPYRGDRSEVLFCCGNGPYNRAIEAVAGAIVNSSVAAARGLSFVWIRQLHAKYAYSDLTAHPLAVLLPYSMHSYGLVQAYALGIPLLAPSLSLLSQLHVTFGICNHKGPGNVPWRRSAQRDRVPFDTWAWLLQSKRTWHSPPPSDNGPCCAHDPNDACDTTAAGRWLQFADWYQWPNVTYFDSVQELLELASSLRADVKRRLEISRAMKRHFAQERVRAEGHVRQALFRTQQAAMRLRAGAAA